jgi:hypothetical protein
MIGSGEIVKYSKEGALMAWESEDRRYLVVGDIFWNGKRCLHCLRIDDNSYSPTGISESYAEVCNEG